MLIFHRSFCSPALTANIFIIQGFYFRERHYSRGNVEDFISAVSHLLGYSAQTNHQEVMYLLMLSLCIM